MLDSTRKTKNAAANFSLLNKIALMVVKNSSKKEVSRLKEWRLDGVTKAKVEQNYTKELADDELEVARLTNK